MKKTEINDYIEEKKNNIGLIKNYLDFRTGVIDGKKWINEMSKMAQERLEKNEDDLVGILVKAQVAIAEIIQRKLHHILTGHLSRWQ